MSLNLGELALRVGRFPRVSGDEPVTTKVRTAPIKFSPRERG